ncbi:MAG: GTP cyclohydrolase II [Acidobacteriota bacterium]|nr:GTP cyclohydrolase II [Acidobacteriota bacterium]
MQKAPIKLTKVPRAQLPTKFGTFEILGFENDVDGEQAVALVKGAPQEETAPLVRIHSQCFTGDTLRSLRCDCGEQLDQALAKIVAVGSGLVIYQMQEGRGIGLINKLYAYEIQDRGVDTVEANLQLGFEADQRSYSFCAEILKYLGIVAIRLMSNNPDKINGLDSEGIEVIERVPLVVKASDMSEGYLRTKKEKMGHLLD